MSGEDLQDLRARLDRLTDVSVDGHPEVLDSVHRSLVGELERLARTAEPPSRAGGA